MVQGVEANVHAAVLQDPKGEQNVEALRNAVVELAKLRQMVESDDAALEVPSPCSLGCSAEFEIYYMCLYACVCFVIYFVCCFWIESCCAVQALPYPRQCTW